MVGIFFNQVGNKIRYDFNHVKDRYQKVKSPDIIHPYIQFKISLSKNIKCVCVEIIIYKNKVYKPRFKIVLETNLNKYNLYKRC